MSVVDSKIVLAVDAETEAARRNFELLRAQQQVFAAEVVKGLEAQNRKMAESIDRWAKIAAGVASVVGAVKIAVASLNEFHRGVELAEATRGVNLERLRASSRGLKSDMELLEFAAKTNAGAFKLTNDQMNLVVRAMEVYEDRGHDSRRVTDALTKAVIEGNTEALKPFGVLVHENGTKAERFQAIMKALTKDVEAAGEASDAGADAWQRQGVAFQNSMSRIKQSIGELVVAITPLIEKVAELVGWVAKVVGDDNFLLTGKSGLSDSDVELLFNVLQEEERVRRGETSSSPMGVARLSRQQREKLGFGPGLSFSESINEAATNARSAQFLSDIERINQSIVLAIESGFEKAAKRGRGPRRADPGTEGEVPAFGVGPLDRLDWGTDDSLASAQFTRFSQGVGDFSGPLLGMRGAAQSRRERATRESRYGDFAAGQAQTRLEQMFGPIEQFNAYQTAWEGLSGAFATGFHALITGSEGAGKAMKKFLADRLAATAVEMGVEALKHGAFAIGSIAFGDPKGAVTHGLAAAKFAAGAFAATTAARMLGAGGSGAAAGAGGGGGTSNVSGGAAAPPPTQQPIIIVYGDAFAEDSPRRRAQSARRLVDLGLEQRASGGSAVSKI